MSNNNITVTIIILTMISLLVGGLYWISSDILQHNDKLDVESQTLITSITGEYINTYNPSILNTSTVDENNTFEGIDQYAREYLESKNEIKQKESMLNRVIKFPSIVLVVFGVSNSYMLVSFSLLIYSLGALLIGIQIYKAFRTGETG